MARERVAKRARADAPANDVGTSAALRSISDLPDGVLGHVLQSLSLASAWPVRGVCRRWRSVIESKAWEEVELRSNDPADFEQLASLLRSGKIKLPAAAASAARLCLRLAARMGADSLRNYSLVASACAVLTACNKDSSCMRSLTEVDLCFVATDISTLNSASIVHAFILGTLAALRPQRGARSFLEKLAIRLEPPPNWEKGRVIFLRGAGLAQKATPGTCKRGAAAAAIARSLPNLQSIHFQPDECEAIAALAPLTLRSLLFALSPEGTRSFFSVNSAALQAIARFPLLEEIDMDLSRPELQPSDLAAFRSPSLRTVNVRVEKDACTVERFQALEKAIAGCPKLSSLSLDLGDSTGTPRNSSVHVEAEAASSLLIACKHVLRGLALHVRRPLAASEADAIHLCAELKFLSVSCNLRSVAHIGPLQQLGACANRFTSPVLHVRLYSQEEGYDRIVKQLLQDAWPGARVSAAFCKI
eukprot:tig00021105_g18282.t1